MEVVTLYRFLDGALMLLLRCAWAGIKYKYSVLGFGVTVFWEVFFSSILEQTVNFQVAFLVISSCFLVHRVQFFPPFS